MRVVGSGVELEGTGMVRREVRGEVEERGVRGPSRRSIEHRACRTLRIRRFSLYMGTRRECNAGSAGPCEAPDNGGTLIWEIPVKTNRGW